MNVLALSEVAHPLSLFADTAEDLMTPNPVSLRDAATIREAHSARMVYAPAIKTEGKLHQLRGAL